MKLKDLSIALDNKIPAKYYCMEHDKVGLFVGDVDRDIKKVVTATDASLDVINYSIENNVDMILCHHPFMFDPVDRLTTSDYFQKKLYKLASNNIAVFSMHTNLDSAPGGLCDICCDLIGLKNTHPILTNKIKNYIFMGFVKKEYKDNILKNFFKAGLGSKNDYENVYFNFKTKNSFIAINNSNPLCNIKNEQVISEEEVITILISEFEIDKALKIYMDSSPYDVPVYNIFDNNNYDEYPCIGRVGELEKEMTCEEFRGMCLDAFQIPYAKCNFNFDQTNKKIKRVGVNSGSGMSIFNDACEHNIDAYICGDIKHDQYLYATERDVFVLDLGHYETECTSSIVLANFIKEIDASIEVVNFEVLRGNKLVKKMLGI